MVGLTVLGILSLMVALTAPSITAVLPADTIVELRRGDRVVLENIEGEITVQAWARDALEVEGVGDEPALIVRRSGSTLRVGPDERKGRRRGLEATLRVPEWIELTAGGRDLDLFVEGVDGRIEVSNVRGDVRIRDVSGPLHVRTVQGEIDVSGARGGVDASSQSDDVRLYDVEGPVTAHSGSGDLDLEDIRSASVRAETQDGDVRFSGTIDEGGDYRFFVHDGDVDLVLPSGINARVDVSTFDGEFQSDFPVVLQRFTGGRKFDFTIGEPRATIEIQVFDGEIRLVRGR